MGVPSACVSPLWPRLRLEQFRGLSPPVQAFVQSRLMWASLQMATFRNQARPLSSCSGPQPRGVHPYLGVKEASREAPGETPVLWGAGISGEAGLLGRAKGRASMGRGGTSPWGGVKVGEFGPRTGPLGAWAISALPTSRNSDQFHFTSILGALAGTARAVSPDLWLGPKRSIGSLLGGLRGARRGPQMQF